nr:MAG TPA: hypothetical protein [Caudoviricetes sp.]
MVLVLKLKPTRVIKIGSILYCKYDDILVVLNEVSQRKRSVFSWLFLI